MEINKLLKAVAYDHSDHNQEGVLVPHIMENDALSLEYKLNEGRARRQTDVSNFANNAVGQSEVRSLGLGVKEELLDLGRRQPHTRP